MLTHSNRIVIIALGLFVLMVALLLSQLGPPRSAAADPQAAVPGSSDAIPGTYEGDGLRVELRRENPLTADVTGVITRGTQQFPLQAKVTDAGRFEGAFQSDGAVFPVAGEVIGDRLALRTGGTTYRCQRVDAQRAAPQPAARPPAGAAKFVYLKRVAIHDQTLRRDAATYLVPDGWQTEGSVVWINSPFYPTRIAMRTLNPRGAEQFTVYPMFDALDGIREAIPQQAAYWPEGSFCNGSEIRRVINHPGTFLQQIIIARQRTDLRGAKVANYEDQPKFADAVAQMAAAQGIHGVQFRAGKLTVQYALNGREMEEAFYTVMYFAPGGYTHSTIWGSEILFSCRAERGALEAEMPLFTAISLSMRYDIGWWNVMDQVRKLRQQESRLQSERVMELSRYITKTYDEINDMRRQAYEYRSKVTSDTNRRFCEAIRGVGSYTSPFESYPVQLPSGYDHVWTSGSGQYILSNDPGFDPNLTQSGNWQRIPAAR